MAIPDTTKEALITYCVASESSPTALAIKSGAVRMLATIANRCAAAARNVFAGSGRSLRPKIRLGPTTSRSSGIVITLLVAYLSTHFALEPSNAQSLACLLVFTDVDGTVSSLIKRSQICGLQKLALKIS